MQPDAGGRARAPRRWRTATLGFVASLGMTDGPYGRYRYAAGSTEPTLDSSTYAAMTRDLYGDLATLSTAEREAWIAYLQSHQDDDGLFRNPVIFDQGWYAGDRESSACEDIDSIDPLARLLAHEPPHRRDDIRTALARGAEVVLAAQAADGGFQFVRGRPFEYGHPQLAAGETEGAMFPTWFRTLTLAYLGRALPACPLGAILWRFCNCPGIQFWLDPRP